MHDRTKRKSLTISLGLRLYVTAMKTSQELSPLGYWSASNQAKFVLHYLSLEVR